MNKVVIAFRKKITADDKILIALFAPFYSAIINSTIVFMLQIEIAHPEFALFRNISILIIGLLFLSALPVILKRAPVFTGVVVSLFIILLALTYLIFPDNIPFLYRQGVLIYTCSVTMPCFIYAYCVRDFDKFYKYMELYASFVIAVCFLILIGIFIFSFGVNNSYSMSLGYSIALASIIYLQKFFTKKTLKDVLFFIIGLFVIINIGSRGPLICMIAFFLAFFILRLFHHETKMRDMMSFSIGAFIFAFIAYILLNPDWLVRLNYFLTDFNTYSRTLYLWLNGNLYTSSGREDIYFFLIQKIKEQPLLGYGIGSDRMMVGMYAHNLFLALFIFFGVIGGILSSLVIISAFVVALMKAKNPKAYALLLTFLSVYFISSMVSGDILTNYGLWILMGISFSIISSNLRFSTDKADSKRRDKYA